MGFAHDGSQGTSQDHSALASSSGSTPSPYDEGRDFVQLPPMTSWAPPSMHQAHQSSNASSRFGSNGNNTPNQFTDTTRSHKRRPSDTEEVEAGIALAGLGLTMPARSEPPSQKPAKKTKKDETKKADKDNKKSCSECRRLKAKCDRVFPCSNCKLKSHTERLTSRSKKRVRACLSGRRFELHAGKTAGPGFH